MIIHHFTIDMMSGAVRIHIDKQIHRWPGIIMSANVLHKVTFFTRTEARLVNETPPTMSYLDAHYATGSSTTWILQQLYESKLNSHETMTLCAKKWLKPDTHYPCSRAVSTEREHWIRVISTGYLHWTVVVFIYQLCDVIVYQPSPVENEKRVLRIKNNQS